MKKIICITLLIMLVFTICSVFYTKTYASDNMLKQAQDFVDHGKSNPLISDADLQTFILPIGRILIVIATIVLVIVSTIIGIKYIITFTTGSPEAQAKLKSQLVGLIVSAVVIFGAQLIWSLVYNLFKDI